jgi:hypothetical protein
MERLGVCAREGPTVTARPSGSSRRDLAITSWGEPGRALATVGNLDGEDVKPGDVEKALAHGEAYQAEKRKHRWGWSQRQDLGVRRHSGPQAGSPTRENPGAMGRLREGRRVPSSRRPSAVSS